MAINRLKKALWRNNDQSSALIDEPSSHSGRSDADEHRGPPGSEILALNRLNLQHFLWTKLFGYKIHPCIPLHDSMSIADVGTGTGIWLLDISDDLPDTVQYYGFDTDIRQAPAPIYRPSNFHFETLDIFGDLPQSLEGQFDIVNVRLFMYVIKNGNPKTIIKNVCKMLKPGGWLQWAEVDMTKRQWIPANEDSSCDALKDMHKTFHSLDPDFKTKSWIGNLDNFLEAAGMISISHDTRSTRDQRTQDKIKKWMHFRNQVAFQTYNAVADQVNSEMWKKSLQALLGAGEKELLDGSASLADHITWVAQKPITN